MYFDSAAKISSLGMGIVFISPQKDIMPYPSIDYLQHGILSDDSQERMNIRRKALRPIPANVVDIRHDTGSTIESDAWVIIGLLWLQTP